MRPGPGCPSRSHGQPLDRPVRLGADPPRRRRHARCCTRSTSTPPTTIATGMRVRVRWADEPVGHISDIACFEPAERYGRRRPPHGSQRTPSRSPGSSPRSTSTTTTPPPRRRRRSCAAWPRAGSSASAARCATRSTSRRAARARPTACRPTDEVELPDTRHGHHVLHRQRAVPGPADRAAVRRRRTSCSTAPTSRSCT